MLEVPGSQRIGPVMHKPEQGSDSDAKGRGLILPYSRLNDYEYLDDAIRDDGDVPIASKHSTANGDESMSPLP